MFGRKMAERQRLIGDVGDREGMDATRPFQASACFMGLVALGATGTALREGCVDKPEGPRAYEELRRQRSKRP